MNIFMAGEFSMRAWLGFCLLAGISLPSMAVAQPFDKPTITIEMLMGTSGMKPPKAVVSDSNRIDSIVAHLNGLLGKSGPCPAPETIGQYSGSRVKLYQVPGGLPDSWLIRDGAASHPGEHPRCVTDSSSRVERAVVSMAFTLEDVSQPGYPQSMDQYRCAVPNHLHPNKPCEPDAIFRIRLPHRIFIGSGKHGFHFLTLDGRKAASSRSPGFLVQVPAGP